MLPTFARQLANRDRQVVDLLQEGLLVSLVANFGQAQLELERAVKLLQMLE